MKKILFLLLALIVSGCESQQTRPKINQHEDKAKLSKIQLKLAAGYFSKGKLEVATQTIEKAIQNDPHSAEALSLAGVMFFSIGDKSKAENYHKRALDIAPKSGSILNNYASFLCQTGRNIEAAEMFVKAVQDPFYNTPYAALSNAATCVISIKKYDLAEEYLRKALTYKPNYQPAMLALADVLHKLKKDFNARAFLERYHNASPPSPVSLMLGYRVENALGDHKAAQEYKQKLASLFPQSEQFRLIK